MEFRGSSEQNNIGALSFWHTWAAHMYNYFLIRQIQRYETEMF